MSLKGIEWGLITILPVIHLELFRERNYIPWKQSLILIVYLLIKWQSRDNAYGENGYISALHKRIPGV